MEVGRAEKRRLGKYRLITEVRVVILARGREVGKISLVELSLMLMPLGSKF